MCSFVIFWSQQMEILMLNIKKQNAQQNTNISLKTVIWTRQYRWIMQRFLDDNDSLPVDYPLCK